MYDESGLCDFLTLAYVDTNTIDVNYYSDNEISSFADFFATVTTGITEFQPAFRKKIPRDSWRPSTTTTISR